MVSSSNTEYNEGEHLPDPQSPEEACIALFKGLAIEPTEENFAHVQSVLNEKVEAAQTDVDSFRFVVKYLRERRQEQAIQALDYSYSADGSPLRNSPYEYTVQYETDEYPAPPTLKEKIARFVLRKDYPEPTKVLKTSTRSVFDYSSRTGVQLPDNWNDLAARYMAYPDHNVIKLPYKSPFNPDSTPEQLLVEDTQTDWDVLKEAKMEYARRLQAQDTGGSTDLNWWGYQSGIDEQAKIVEELNDTMGLIYKDGYLVEEAE